jgi:hypothetical protein
MEIERTAGGPVNGVLVPLAPMGKETSALQGEWFGQAIKINPVVG